MGFYYLILLSGVRIIFQFPIRLIARVYVAALLVAGSGILPVVMHTWAVLMLVLIRAVASPPLPRAPLVSYLAVSSVGMTTLDHTTKIPIGLGLGRPQTETPE